MSAENGLKKRLRAVQIAFGRWDNPLLRTGGALQCALWRIVAWGAVQVNLEVTHSTPGEVVIL
jgi:hypothetical protein